MPAQPPRTFPTKPITFVVPFPPGGGTDAMARTVAERMSRTLGQQVVVENRGGAGGTIGTRAVAKAAPDGYTILLSYTGTFAINPTLYTNAGYDPRKDFAPIGIIGLMPSVLVVHPSVPARTTAELIAYGKANPGKINYAFVPGTVGHITTELFARTAGIELTKIPYKGNGDALANLIGGHVSMMFLSIAPIIGNVKGGKLHALAVTTAERSPLLPDVPPIAESGVAGVLGRDQLRDRCAARHAAPDRRQAQQGASHGAGRRTAAGQARERRRLRRSRPRPTNTRLPSTPKKRNGRRSSKVST